MSLIPVAKVREESLSVILSEILEETGITNLSLLSMGKVPDIYMLLKGVRIIIETKETGKRKELEDQMTERLERNMCDIIVGLEYPIDFVKGQFTPPTTKAIRKNLMTKRVLVHALAQGVTGPKPLFEDLAIKVPELPELLSEIATQSLLDEELDEAIERIRSSVKRFVDAISELDASQSIAESIREELEIGKE